MDNRVVDEQDFHLRNIAHLGDAVYELFIREITIKMTHDTQKLHKMTTSFVRAEFQAKLLQDLSEYLTVEESDIVRRARNIHTATRKRANQSEYRQSTAFEALIGWLYLHNKDRLSELFLLIKPSIVMPE